MANATRVPVPITSGERAEILDGMKRTGIRAMADFLRQGALEKARGCAGGQWGTGAPRFAAKERGE